MVVFVMELADSALFGLLVRDVVKRSVNMERTQ